MSFEKQPNLNPIFEGVPDRPSSPGDGPASEDARQPMLPKPASGTTNGVTLLPPGKVGIFHPTRALYRWIIMVSISMLSVSGYYLYDNIGSMEQTIEDVRYLRTPVMLTIRT